MKEAGDVRIQTFFFFFSISLLQQSNIHVDLASHRPVSFTMEKLAGSVENSPAW